MSNAVCKCKKTQGLKGKVEIFCSLSYNNEIFQISWFVGFSKQTKQKGKELRGH